MIVTRHKHTNGNQQSGGFCTCGAQLVRWHRTGATPTGVCPLGRTIRCLKCKQIHDELLWSGYMTKQVEYV
jgi:hypothetical protein